jgi:hypothetical protein
MIWMMGVLIREWEGRERQRRLAVGKKNAQLVSKLAEKDSDVSTSQET